MTGGAKLYALRHSHPVVAARLMLERKGVEPEVREILPGLHPIVVRAAGFPERTVPALRVDGRRIQGTLAISRSLDELFPVSPLFPADPERRAAVEAAERWGHDELQELARRVFRFAAMRSNAVRAWMAGEVVGMPLPRLMALVYKPVIVYFARIVDATGDVVQRDLERLPGLLDRADELIADGIIGGEEPNAADYQVLCSIRLLLCHAELRPLLEHRRCAQEALRLAPDYPGPVPAALPREWLRALADSPAATG